MNVGIPTLYRDIRFRSRHEARVAAFFDLLGWPWEYEPFDLDGYIPDFVLPFKAGDLLVEVKPDLRLADLERQELRVTLAGWEKEFAVVGGRLFEADGQASIGLLYEPLSWNGQREWASAPGIIFSCINCGATSLRSADHSFRCRVSGCYAGAGHVGEFHPSEAKRLWAEATNRVQWRAA